MKNEVYGENFEYTGNNTFAYPTMPAAYETKLHFEIMPTGSIILTSSVDSYWIRVLICN
jgi:hypothetical protein